MSLTPTSHLIFDPCTISLTPALYFFPFVSNHHSISLTPTLYTYPLHCIFAPCTVPLTLHYFFNPQTMSLTTTLFLLASTYCIILTKSHQKTQMLLFFSNIVYMTSKSLKLCMKIISIVIYPLMSVAMTLTHFQDIKRVFENNDGLFQFFMWT